MTALFDFTLFDSAVCPRLVLTLGHFLWQGLVVGGLAWVAGRALRGCSSSTRYQADLAFLAVMSACPLLTLFWIGREAPPPAVAEPGFVAAETLPPEPSEMPPGVPADTDGAWTPSREEPVISGGAGIDGTRAADRLVPPPPAEVTAARTDWRRFAPALTAVYFAGVLLMLMRLALGLHGGRGLRRRSEPVADPALLDLLARRAAAVRLRWVPVLAWCREVAVPTVVGVVRPTILLPPSLATGLTSEQLAAILTHELAHIRRWDPLVNVFQRVIEAVLFFHPMVWYVSRRIRQERENCCDDLVLATGTDPVGYASSLLNVAERAADRRQSVAALAALRADGRPSELGGRIRRLLGAEQYEAMRLNRPGLVLAAVIAFLTLAVLSRLAVNAEDEPSEKTATTPRATFPNDVVVELVGIAVDPWEDDRWWRPDGRPLADIPQIRGRSTGATNELFFRRSFVLEARNLPGDAVHQMTVAPSQGGSAVAHRGDDGSLQVRATQSIPKDAETATVRFGFAASDWRTVLRLNRTGEPQGEPAPLGRDVGFDRLAAADDGAELVLRVPDEVDGEKVEYRASIVDETGTEHRPIRTGKKHDGNQVELTHKYPVAPDRVRELRVQAAAYRHWVTFRNVALQPGQRTDVEIETEAAEAVMPDDEQQAWRELEAMQGLGLHGEPFHRGHLRRQLALLERINSPGAQRKKIQEQLEEPVRSAELWRVPAEAWPLIVRLESLHDLRIVASDLGEEALRHVARLPNLRRINLVKSNVLPADAAVLKSSTPLEHVEILFNLFDMPAEWRQESLGELTRAEQAWAEAYGARPGNRDDIVQAAILTDRMLEELRALPRLRTLRLGHTHASGRGVEALGVHRELEVLDLNIADLTPGAVRAIGRLKQLRKFRHAEVSDETLAAFAGLTKLEELELWAGDVTDAGVQHVLPLKSLRKLALRGSSISDAGLLELAALPHLERLDLKYGKGELTAEGLARFQSLKPECDVIADADTKEIPPGTEPNAADGEATDAAAASSAVAPADQTPSDRDAFAEAVATRVAGHLPFLRDEHRQQTAAEFRELVQKYGPAQPPPEFVQAILDALDRRLQRDFPEGPRVEDPALRDRYYIRLPAEIRKLQWRVFMALRPPLDEAAQTRLAEQIAWMREHISSLPQPPEAFDRAGRAHERALAQLHQRFEDPLDPIFQEPLSNEKFATFQQRVQDHSRRVRDRAALTVLQNLAWSFFYAHYDRVSPIPVPVLETFDEQPFSREAQRRLPLRFPSSETFLGERNAISDCRNPGMFTGSFISLSSDQPQVGFAGPDREASLEELVRWFAEEEDRGHVIFDEQGMRLIGMHGTRLAPLKARRFFEVDRIPTERLIEHVEQEGSQFWKLPQPVSRDEVAGDQYDALAAVLTSEGRLFVLQIQEHSPGGLSFHVRLHQPHRDEIEEPAGDPQ